MKKIFFISVLALTLMTAASCKKDEGGIVTDKNLLIQAVKTRIDMDFHYDLNTTSSAKISTSDGTFDYYVWKNSDDLAPWVALGWCEKLACAYPTIYGEDYTRLKIVANKAVTAKVVTTGDNPSCVTILPSNDGMSFEVKYDASATGTGNGAAYILIRSTDGASTKLISVGAYKTLPQTMSSFNTTMTYEIYEPDTSKVSQSSQSISALDNDTTSQFSIDYGYVIRFKGIGHGYKNDYDVHNCYVTTWLDTLRSYRRTPESKLVYSDYLINIGNDSYYKCDTPGYVTLEIRSNTVDSIQGKVKSQWFVFQVNKQKE